MRKSLGILSGLATLAAIGLTTQAQAAIITVEETLDVSSLDGASGFIGLSGVPPFSTPFSVDIAEGDTFDFTIDFHGDQTLTVDDLSFIWAYSYADVSTYVTGTGTFSFLDADGNAFLTSEVTTSNEGLIHFGQQFYSTDFSGGFPTSLTFSGVRYVGVVDDYDEPGVTSRTYYSPNFFLDAGLITVGTAVPEPAAWAMMVLGLGMVGGALRRSPKGTRATALA